jgi:CHAT domain-containing protein
MSLALKDWQAVNNRPKINVALSNLGAVHLRLGEKQKALELFQKSLALSREINDRRNESQALSNIAGIYNSLGDYHRAAEDAEQAIQIRRAISDVRGVAQSLHEAGIAYDGLGEKEKALRYLNEALALRRSTTDRSGEATTLSRIARVERDGGQLADARAHIEETLLIVESLRTNINSQQLRASYFATVQGYYDFYIELLMQMHEREPAGGHSAEALAASERARARSLLDLMQEARIDVRRDADPALVEREAAVRTQLNKAAERQARLQGNKAAATELATVAREVETSTTELTEVQSRLRQSSPRYAALTHPQPLELAEIQDKLLDSDTLLLEYKLGEKRSFLWLVTQQEVLSYALPPRAEIETLAREVYSSLTARSLTPKPGESLAAVQSRRRDVAADYWRLSGKLVDMILAPAAARLEKKRLLIVAEGALQYIPFGALPAPVIASAREANQGRGKTSANANLKAPVALRSTNAVARSTTFDPVPLIAEREIISLPSVSVLAELRREASGRKLAEKSVAVIADPVFEKDDPRIKAAIEKNRPGSNALSSSSSPLQLDAASQPDASSPSTDLSSAKMELKRATTETGLTRDAASGIPRLIATRQEASAILSAVPASSSMRAFDFEASRDTAESSELARYRFIHFATHGLLNAEHPELSGLILSLLDREGHPIDGFLRLHEIYDLKLPAELVVLSACSTGLGKDVKGEGLIGLTRGFMYAGAPRVVASLWKVDDEATSELMTYFYKGMLKNKLRPAAALRAAQIEMHNQTRWRSPYNWAAFVLQGEWK